MTQRVYASVYSLIKNAAMEFGYKNVEVCCWPGQVAAKKDDLTLDGAVRIARAKIVEWEDKKQNYSLLARSFGTVVAAKSINEMSEENVILSYLRRIVLWGPPPYSVVWKLFKRDLDKNVITAKEKGTRVSRFFFDSMTPFESLVNSINHECVIATGEIDSLCPPGFLNY